MIIVLHHGLFGFGEVSVGPLRWTYFQRIDRAIAAAGHSVIISRVHPTAGIETRARQLKSDILRKLKLIGREREPVVVLGHSMGGLDARFMIRHLGMSSRVAALVTVTTPHRGSPYADWIVRNLGDRLGALRMVNKLGLDVAAFSDLTTENCRRFNEEVPDHPDVRYFSVSAARARHKMPPFAWHAHKIVEEAEGENDFLVSVKSSTWGEHLGTWPADHLHTINKRYVPEFKDATGDISPYYLRMISEVGGKCELLSGSEDPLGGISAPVSNPQSALLSESTPAFPAP